jgi:hypothetical protein
MAKKKLPPVHVYRKRVLKSAAIAFAFIFFSLLLGMAGYIYYFHLGWVDALLNASMILTGMGPVDKAFTNDAKIFASFYAVYSGVAFLTSVAVLLSPVVHRFLHRFHLDIEE